MVDVLEPDRRMLAAEQITSGLLVSMNTDDAWFEGDIVQYYRMISALDGAAAPLARRVIA